jgi:hypothetical protein
MSTILRDLWPSDIGGDDVTPPEEILRHQAKLLGEKTSGLLAAEVVTHESQDRIVLGFEVIATRADVRARLFEAQHRVEFEYPCAIIPPDKDLPDYLKDQVYHPGMGEAIRFTTSGTWVKNEWVATSPSEFSKQVQAVLARPAVKAIVLSLLSRSRPPEPGDAGNTS